METMEAKAKEMVALGAAALGTVLTLALVVVASFMESSLCLVRKHGTTKI